MVEWFCVKESPNAIPIGRTVLEPLISLDLYSLVVFSFVIHGGVVLPFQFSCVNCVLRVKVDYSISYNSFEFSPCFITKIYLELLIANLPFSKNANFSSVAN